MNKYVVKQAANDIAQEYIKSFLQGADFAPDVDTLVGDEFGTGTFADAVKAQLVALFDPELTKVFLEPYFMEKSEFSEDEPSQKF